MRHRTPLVGGQDVRSRTTSSFGMRPHTAGRKTCRIRSFVSHTRPSRSPYSSRRRREPGANATLESARLRLFFEQIVAEDRTSMKPAPGALWRRSAFVNSGRPQRMGKANSTRERSDIRPAFRASRRHKSSIARSLDFVNAHATSGCVCFSLRLVISDVIFLGRECRVMANHGNSLFSTAVIDVSACPMA